MYCTGESKLQPLLCLWGRRSSCCWLFEGIKLVGKQNTVKAEGQPLTVLESTSQPHQDSIEETDQLSEASVTTINNTTQPCKFIAPLTGRKSLLKCTIAGYAVSALLDTGDNASLLDHTWKNSIYLAMMFDPSVTYRMTP